MAVASVSALARQIAAATLASLALSAGAVVAFDAVGDSARFRPPHCPAEDTCAIDYGRHGWRIRVCEAACDDRDARHGWQRLYVRER